MTVRVNRVFCRVQGCSNKIKNRSSGVCYNHYHTDACHCVICAGPRDNLARKRAVTLPPVPFDVPQYKPPVTRASKVPVVSEDEETMT